MNRPTSALGVKSLFVTLLAFVALAAGTVGGIAGPVVYYSLIEAAPDKILTVRGGGVDNGGAEIYGGRGDVAYVYVQSTGGTSRSDVTSINMLAHNLHFQGGDAESGSDGNGGNFIFHIGLKDGAGSNGNLYVFNLPTSAPTAHCALYSDTGTIKISTCP